MQNNGNDEREPHMGEPVPGRRVSGWDGAHQDDTAGPIVEHPYLPRMDEQGLPPRPIQGVVRLMDETSAGAALGARGQMPTVPNGLGPNSGAAGGPNSGGPNSGGTGEYPPQQPAPTSTYAAEAGGYVRLLLRVEGDQVSVVGASRVPGPLSPAGPLHGGLAYEVSLGREHLSSGDVPDPGVRRGFVSPDAPGRGHHVVAVPSYEFTVRIPAERISVANLPDMQVSVYRMDASQVVQPTPQRPLRAYSGQVAEEVVSLNGIRPEDLPSQVRVDVERAFR